MIDNLHETPPGNMRITLFGREQPLLMRGNVLSGTPGLDASMYAAQRAGMTYQSAAGLSVLGTEDLTTRMSPFISLECCRRAL